MRRYFLLDVIIAAAVLVLIADILIIIQLMQ